MRKMVQLNVDQYLEVVTLAKKNGKVAGESMEEELKIISDKYNLKTSGTELTNKELVNEIKSHGKKVLDLTKDKNENT